MPSIRKILLLFTFALDLLLRTIKLSPVFGVFTDAWWSVPYTDVHRNCYTLLRGRPSIVVAHSCTAAVINR